MIEHGGEGGDQKGVLENQKAISSEVLMSDLGRIGRYELLEKRNEGYEQESTQLGVESGLTSIKHAIEIRMRWC